MKKNNGNSIPARRAASPWIFLLIGTALLIFLTSPARAIDWTGLSGVTNLWSDTNNWSPAQVPSASDAVTFTNTGSANAVGVVNNAVGASITVSNLAYTAVSNSIAVQTHTTLINPGVFLTVNSGTYDTNAPALLVGGDVVNADDVAHATITSAGTLAVGSLASPDTNKDIVISARILTATGGPHKGTLDMSGLDNFTFGGGRFQVAANGIAAALAGQSQYVGMDRANGNVFLAKTNVITAARARGVAFPFSRMPVAVGAHFYANGPGAPGPLFELGQENTINAEGLVVGGERCNQTATMRFRSGTIAPTLKLRGADGTSRMAELGIGDNATHNGTVASLGVMDLAIGSGNILVDTMFVGRNNMFGTSITTAGAGTGTLTLGAGTCDVLTLNLGCQGANNAGIATGTFNVRTNATLTAGTINMGRDMGSGAGNARSTLTIQGGTVKVYGDIVKNDAAGGVGGTNTITINTDGVLDMMPAGDTTPGNIEVFTLNIGAGTLTNYGTLGARFILQTAPREDFVVYPGQVLAPIAPGLVGPLAVRSNLVLNSSTLRLDLADPGASDQIIVTNILTLNGVNTVDIHPVNGIISAGTYTLMTYGTLVGGLGNLQLSAALTNSRYSAALVTNTVPNIDLVLSGAAVNLIWSGDGSGNAWNKSSSNWNSNAEKFFDLDPVTFDDSGSANSPVNLSGTLSPASITVNSSANYTLAGSGKISGNGGLTNSGGGILTIATTNDYIGSTLLSAGTVLINGKLGNTPVTVGNSATLGGNGTILGTVTVTSGGTLAPGTSIGTLAISNNLVLSSGSSSVFEADMDATTLDKVVGLSKVTYGGTLSLNLSGRALVAGDTFKLFSAANYSGTFASIVPAEPGPDLVWNTGTLTTDGTLRVRSTIALPSLIAQVTGNQLNLSWPSENIGWRLQAQTNSLNVGISTNWTDVTGSEGSNNFNTTINPANGTVFYRLASPP